MSIIVQKYGGTSVGSIEKMKVVAKNVISQKENGNDIVIVVSAMGKTTDKLIEMAKEISQNPCRRELDMLLSTGEQVSISLLSMIFKEYGYDSISLTGFQAGILTKGAHTKNRISDINIQKVKKYLSEGKIVVVAGFQGINTSGDITTLGRGGSDTTAVALAAKLGCMAEIYTDVEGIYTVDPRLYSMAKKLDYISYEEMMEMASLGAGVMETRAVEIGCKFNVPIYVALNTGNKKGTYIKEYDKHMEEKVITGLSINDDILMVTINNIQYDINTISSIFDKLASNSINVDMISQTAPTNGYVNISFTVSKEDTYTIDNIGDDLKNELKDIYLSKESNLSKISVVGIGMRTQSGVAAKIFKIFADNNIKFKQVTTSEISISYTIDLDDKEKTVALISKEFNL